MRAVSTKDGSKTFYKEWGSGRPMVFFHGWPPSTAAEGAQTSSLALHGVAETHRDRLNTDLLTPSMHDTELGRRPSRGRYASARPKNSPSERR